MGKLARGRAKARSNGRWRVPKLAPGRKRLDNTRKATKHAVERLKWQDTTKAIVEAAHGLAMFNLVGGGSGFSPGTVAAQTANKLIVHASSNPEPFGDKADRRSEMAEYIAWVAARLNDVADRVRGDSND